MISFLNPIYNFTRIGEHKESISLCLFREMKWQMVGFVREGNMAAAIFLQPGKNP